jgi:hypothetical protein
VSRNQKPANIFVADLSRVLLGLQPSYDRLLVHHKIPSGAFVSRISPAYFPAIIALHQLVTPDNHDEVALRLRGLSHVLNYCQRTSTLLLLDKKPIGVTLVLSRKNYPLAYLYLIVVAPEWRRTWATGYLKYHSISHLMSVGFTKIAFQAFGGHPDTLKHAKKVGATSVVDNYQWNG